MQEYKFKPYTVEHFNQGFRSVIYKITGKVWDVTSLRLPEGEEIAATVELTKTKLEHSTKLTVNIENLLLEPQLVLSGKPVYEGDQVWISGLHKDPALSMTFAGMRLHGTDVCCVKITTLADDCQSERYVTADTLCLVEEGVAAQQPELTLQQKIDEVKVSLQRGHFNLATLRLIRDLLPE